MPTDDEAAPEGNGMPAVLFVYYSYTGQTKKVLDVMAAVLRERGCDVQLASIIFTDPRYVHRFAEFPMPHPFLEVLGMLPAGFRRRPGTIEIPATATQRDYDLVVVGSPTWWLSTNVPIRSFLESETAAGVLAGKPFAGFVVCRRYWRHNLKTVRRLGAERGGEFLDGIHFKYAGGQVRSLLSLISYLGSGQYRDRYLGVKIPRTNIRGEQLDTARKFANQLGDELRAAANPSA